MSPYGLRSDISKCLWSQFRADQGFFYLTRLEPFVISAVRVEFAPNGSDA